MPHHSLKKIHIENFKGIISLELSDLPSSAPWIFLTGENGYGKTSVLQGIASGLAGSGDHILEFFRKSPSPIVKILLNTKNGLGDVFDIQNGQRFLKSIDPKDSHSAKIFPYLACYGSSRLDTYTEASSEVRTGEVTLNLFESRTLLQNIELQLSRWFFKKDDPEFDQKYTHVTALLKRLLGVNEITVDKKSDKVFYTEQDDEGNSYQSLPSSQLASGYRSIISMIGDMVLRLFKTQPSVTNPSELKGIVIIDELDLHFHPKWQKILPSLLSDIFPEIQFVVSTHSPIPLLGAPPNSVFIRVNRSLQEGITLERLEDIEEQIGDMLPTAILTSPVFGLQDIFPSSHDENGRIRTEDTYDEMLVNDFIRDKLSKYDDKKMKNDLEEYLKSKKA